MTSSTELDHVDGLEFGSGGTLAQRLSPETVRRFEFGRSPIGRRGYNEADVEHFRGRVVHEVVQSTAERAALRQELQLRVELAGVRIEEAKLTHLAYAPEIAGAMLRRQQAEAVIAARAKIVVGAVSMVEMALRQLSEKNVVELDDERRAAMVSNLMVVLCSDRDTQPVVNTGTLYT